MNPTRRALKISAAAVLGGYILAGGIETLAIRALHPSQWELESVSDVVLAVCLGAAVFMWVHLLATRHALAERERADLVVNTQLALAAEIQKGLLPVLPPPTGDFDCAAALKSAGAVGGDFYDVIETEPGVWLVLVADVSGKGIPAALALGSLRMTFRSLVRQHLQPAQIVTQISEAFLQEWRGSPYVTCIVLAFDLRAGTLTYTNAGHPRGIVVGSHGVRYLDRGGAPAGLLPRADYESEVLRMAAGDTCLLVSDGVTEALENSPCLDLALVASGGEQSSAADLCEVVMARALEGTGPTSAAGWDDDRTVVVVRVGRASAAAAAEPHSRPVAIRAMLEARV
jgi:phosphoserine phosphatase RsbU/P